MTSLSRALGLAVASLLCVLVLVPLTHAQTITINEARNQGVGATVTVEGTVTRAFGNFVRFQDGSGPTGASGLVVRQTSGSFHDDIADGTITQGTQLQVSGTLSEFKGLLQINEGDLTDYAVRGQGSLPDSQSVTLATLKADGEDYESELVRVTGLDFLHAQGTFAQDTSYPVTDGSGTATLADGTLAFRVQDGSETAIVGTSVPEGRFDYTGVVGEFSGQYQLIPVQPADVQPARSFGFVRQFAQAEEGSGTVTVDVAAFATESGDDVSVTARAGSESTASNGTDITGFSSPQTLTFSGDDPSPQTLSFDVAADSETEGVERLEVVLESNDGELARPKRFTLWVLDDPTAQGPIAEGDSGNALIDTLQQRYGDPRPLGYDLARDSMYARIYNESGTVEGTYSGFQVSVNPNSDDPSADAFAQGINTEHTWPQSKGAGQEPAKSNLHILMPTRMEVNSARCNYPYAEIADSTTERWFRNDMVQTQPPSSNRETYSESVGNDCGNPSPDGQFEPRHSVKGDVARAVFYFVTVYPNRADLSFYEAQKDTLMAWHQRDPVDATEMRRNLTQASYQDNAVNPFVVDPTLVDRAYGSGGGTPGGNVIPISEARSKGVGAAVTVEGTVTRAYGDFVRLQDESGPTGASALVVRQTSGAFHDDIADGTIAQGTQLEVSGTLSAFNGLFQINEGDLNSYAVQGQGSLPAPQSVSLADLQAPDGETYESELVRIPGLSFPSASGSFSGGTTYTVKGPDGTTFEFRVQGSDESQLAGASIPTGTFTYEGVVGQYNGAGFEDKPDEGYQLIPVRPETALPVEMAGFDAVQTGSSVELTWQTASETNNARFEVQRQASGGDWAQIGSVKGHGTTETAQSYRFTDAEPPFEADALTYRLKQVDLDGSTSYSDPVTVQRDVEQATLRAPFPNPAQGQARVPFAVPGRQDVTLRLYDVLGRRVRTLVNGTRTGRQEARVDLSGLSSGVYFLRLRADDHVRTRRVTVVQ